MPRYIGAYLRRRAPQGYLFRFAPLRGRPPLRTVYRWSFRRGRCPHRPVCHGSAAASSLPCVKEAQCSHWVVRRSVAEVSRRSRDGGRDTDAPHPLYPSVGEGFYPSCRYCITFRAGQSPAPTPVYRVCATPRSGVIARPVRRLVVAIRFPRPYLPRRGRCRPQGDGGRDVIRSFLSPSQRFALPAPPRGGREITPPLLFPLPLLL